MANQRRHVVRINPPSAGRMRAQQPAPTNVTSRTTKGQVHLDDVKLEGDPLELKGNGVDVTVGSNPTAPGQAIKEGYRLLLRNTDALRAALGIDLSDNLWIQAHGKALRIYTVDANNPTFQLTGGGLCRVGQSATAPASTLSIAGSIDYRSSFLTGNTTLDATHCYLSCDAAGGAFTVTLPAASGLTGRVYIAKRTNSGVNAVTVAANGAETIDGAATKALNSQYACLVVICTGAGWSIISTFGTVA